MVYSAAVGESSSFILAWCHRQRGVSANVHFSGQVEASVRDAIGKVMNLKFDLLPFNFYTLACPSASALMQWEAVDEWLACRLLDL